MQIVVIIMHSVNVKGQPGIFASLIKASLSSPANLGTLLLLMTFLDPCLGLKRYCLWIQVMRLLLILNKWGKLFNNYSALSVGDLSFVEMKCICLSSPPCKDFDFLRLVLLN